MPRHRLLVATALLLGLAAAACKGPVVANPMAGQTRYLCCNLYYEKTEIADVNFHVGTMIALGTPVHVLEVRRYSVKFQPEGYEPLTMVLKYGKDFISIDTLMNDWFVDEDPRGALRKMPAKTVQAIETGSVEPGMTRAQVLMALGYPPRHRTPTLEQPDWHYWQNRWHQYIVWFEGDRVGRVQQ
jgi:hypothetical protein